MHQKSVIRLFAQTIVGAALLTSARSTLADGFLSNLNPFASKTTAPAVNNTAPMSTGVITPSSHSSSVIGSPSIAGKAVHPPAATPSQPSLLSRMSSGTANLFSKTKQMFSPSSPAPTKVTGGPGSSTTTPKTVTQFIGQPRP